MNSKASNYYEVLDVSFNATPEAIRTAYIRAKNAYNRDSLAAYSLFGSEESQNILSEIEEAFNVLSDVERRRRYDESHGILTSDTSHYNSSMPTEVHRPAPAFVQPVLSSAATIAASTPVASPSAPVGSPIDRLKSLQEGSSSAFGGVKATAARTRHVENPEMEKEIAEVSSVNGAFLKRVREYKGVSPEEIMDILKISKNYLTALEEDVVEKLPANVFVRGFVIQYAKALKVDQDKFATKYMEFLRQRRG